MKKRTFVAFLVVLILPVVSYFIVNSYSKDAIAMPRHYFYDTVVTKLQNGKPVDDTIWHKIKSFKLLNQFGDSVGIDDWGGKIIVANFFFTSCPSICPTLTRNMKMLQTAFIKTDTIVRFISFTVDPSRDTVQKIKAFGDKYGINHDTWWMLTGPKKEIYDIAFNEFKVYANSVEKVDSSFIHTDKFILIDRDKVVRGFYDGLDSNHLDQLIKDIVLLNMERDKKRKRNLFRK